MNILLVEDDYLLGRCTARRLEIAGLHRVSLTHKAADVFKHCQSGAVDLVIMDVNLPGTFWQEEEVTGVDLSRMLKLQPRTARVPVVLLSANTTDTEQGRLKGDALADAIYSKPITDADEFLVLLIQVSGGRGFQGLTASAS